MMVKMKGKESYPYYIILCVFVLSIVSTMPAFAVNSEQKRITLWQIDDTSYWYKCEGNGNMTSDLNKGIVSITYNALNLPMLIEASDGSEIALTYDAAGNLLSRNAIITRIRNGAPVSERVTEDRFGDFTYSGSTLKRIDLPSGYFSNDSVYYYIRDYQGNIRQVIDSDGEVVQENMYYPFGMLMAESSDIVDSGTPDNNRNRYFYGGKEHLPTGGMNLYDFTGRYYDPTLAIFTGQDIFQEDCHAVSSYLYYFCDPINRIDPTGMKVIANGQDIQDMIRNTLPKGAYSYLKFDENGILDASALSAYANEGGSQNFSDLLAMASSGDYKFEIYLNDHLFYIDPEGNFDTIYMNDIQTDPKPSQDGIYLRTGEEGWVGHFATPGQQRSFNSTNENIQITIHSGLSISGTAQALSHELYGHGYVFMISGGDLNQSIHGPFIGQKDTNIILYNRIERAIDETIKNMSK